jgi:subtilisin family serine protease
MLSPRVAIALLLALALGAGAVPMRGEPAAPPTSPASLTAAPAALPSWLLAAEAAGPPKTGGLDGMTSYIVVLDEPPLASYAGGLPGLAATSPRARGETGLTPNTVAARSYLSHLAAQRGALLSRMASALGRPIAPSFTYSYVLNGLAAALTPAEAAAAATLPGVRLVAPAGERFVAAGEAPALIGAAQADLRPALFAADLGAPGSDATGRAIVSYDAVAGRLGVRLDYTGLAGPPAEAHLIAPGGRSLKLSALAAPEGPLFAGEHSLEPGPVATALLAGELQVVVRADGVAIAGTLRPVRGEGMTAAVIDSGITADHPAFADVGGDGYDHTNPRGAGSYLGVCLQADRSGPPFPCNDKLIGAYTFAATSQAVDPAGRPSPFDDEGHGTHTAGILAGNLVPGPTVGGVPVGPAGGVAPHASLVAYDVCGTTRPGVCPLESIVAGIDRAAADGVAVANFSVSGFPGDPWREPDALALLGALDAGVLASVSAGNNGPRSGTVGAPANAPWAMAVGASTHGRRYTRVLADLSGGDAIPPGPLAGGGFGADALALTPIVDAAGFRDFSGAPNGACFPFAEGARLAGAIVVCQQLLGPETIVEHVAEAGGAGVVITWPARAADQAPLGPSALPTIHLDAEAGAELRAWLAAGSGHRASLSAAVPSSGPADGVAWFSGRGPGRFAADTLKPDLMAPGVNILGPFNGPGLAAPGYAFLSGTSMAAPHAAGAALLLRQLHPGWSPMEVRSALMTTAQPALITAEGAPATPHDAGAGRLRVGLAARAGLLLDETAARFRAADPRLGGDPSQLNLPSLSSGVCLEQCVFTRTLHSALPAPASWEATTEAGPGLTLDVEPARFTIPPGGTQTVVITAHVAREKFAPPGSFLYGAVTLAEQGELAPAARLPVALDAPSAILPPRLTVRAEAPAGSSTTPPLRTSSTPELTLRVLGPVRGETRPITVAQDPTPADPLDGGPGVVNVTLEVPAGTPRAYLAIEQATAPDLDLFVFADGEGGPEDGAAQAAELVCLSATYASGERCDLKLDGDAARRLIVVVQSYSGSGAGEDTARLRVALVPTAEQGGIMAAGPRAVRAGEVFGATISWELPEGPEMGGLYLAALELSSSADPADAGDLGVVPLDLIYWPERLYVPQIWP